MKEKNIAIMLGIMCFLLTVGICVQMRTVTSNASKMGKTYAENELRDSVLKWKEKYDFAYDSLEKKEARLESLRESVSESSETSEAVKAELEKNNMALGYSEVIGPGVTVTLKDGEVSNSKLDVSSYLVHYSDLIEVINALKNAGAEAISVNGERIVNTTAITCAGNIIKINNEKVGVPFVINAIGSKEKLYGAITMLGGYIDKLKEDGVGVEITQQNSITIPKYDGVYKFEYAQVAE